MARLEYDPDYPDPCDTCAIMYLGYSNTACGDCEKLRIASEHWAEPEARNNGKY